MQVPDVIFRSYTQVQTIGELTLLFMPPLRV